MPVGRAPLGDITNSTANIHEPPALPDQTKVCPRARSINAAQPVSSGLTMDLLHCTAQVPNNSQLYLDHKHKQEEWANMQQLSGRPVTMVEFKPPKPQPKKKKPTSSHLITSFYLPH
jgi:hypothetical protein